MLFQRDIPTTDPTSTRISTISATMDCKSRDAATYEFQSCRLVEQARGNVKIGMGVVGSKSFEHIERKISPAIASPISDVLRLKEPPVGGGNEDNCFSAINDTKIIVFAPALGSGESFEG